MFSCRIIPVSAAVSATVASIIITTVGASTTTSELWPYQTYVTEPTFYPPRPAINHTDGAALAPGLVVFSPSGGVSGTTSAMIMDREGELVWQTDPAWGDIQDLTVFDLFGEKVLISWSGENLNTGDSFGTATIWSDSYEPIYNITLNDPQFEHIYGQYDTLLNQHEVYITSRGTFLGLVYDPIPANLSAVGGPEDGWIRDGVVVEIDIKTNELLFVWRASDFIPITDSYCPMVDVRSGFVGELSSGQIVASSRHTFQAIVIDRETGSVDWIIQGEGKNDFTIDEDAVFRWQHDIRIQETAEGLLTMSLHNNQNNYTPPYNHTSANLMRIDQDSNHVSSIQVYQDPNDPVSTPSGGSCQPLSNDNVFVCHASQPVMKEYTHDGELLWSFRFGPAGYATGSGIGSYRGFVSEWHGYPETAPKAAACKTAGGDLQVFMSWNGATEVTAWNVYSGNGTRTLSPAVRNVARRGFETNTTIPEARYVQVEALGGCRDLDETRRSGILDISDAAAC
ncbi:Arylsulfotransferase-domain-containing protein [Xylariomycetidae sp. FL2044]|nr:Arylsulfotransferase-domain-containing protein [Xylariomycetidae sp. FL2044]